MNLSTAIKKTQKKDLQAQKDMETLQAKIQKQQPVRKRRLFRAILFDWGFPKKWVNAKIPLNQDIPFVKTDDGYDLRLEESPVSLGQERLQIFISCPRCGRNCWYTMDNYSGPSWKRLQDIVEKIDRMRTTSYCYFGCDQPVKKPFSVKEKITKFFLNNSGRDRP